MPNYSFKNIIRVAKYWQYVMKVLFLMHIRTIPIVLVAVAGLWIPRSLGIVVPECDAHFFVDMAYMALLILHTILCAELFRNASEHRESMRKCLGNDDMYILFSDLRNDPPPYEPMKIFVGMLSAIIVILPSCLHFTSLWLQIILIAVITDMLSCFWVIITDLEDPTSGIWIDKKALEWVVLEISDDPQVVIGIRDQQPEPAE